MSISTPISVFDKDVYGTEWYRIPSIVKTRNGVVVACCDARHYGSCDNPNRIDKIVRRSHDDGETWGETIVVAKGQGTSRMESSAAIDPQMTYDSEHNRIILIYAYTPAGIGIFNARIEKGFDSKGRQHLKKGLSSYYIDGDKIVSGSDKDTGYRVDEQGNITKDGQSLGNTSCKGKFKLASTFYLMLTVSDDDGMTWSEPKCINSMIKGDNMGFLCAGPGIGIVKKHAPHKGRYILPIYFGTRVLPFRMSSAIIYSDDQGLTWQMGGSPNDNRECNGKTVNVMNVKDGQMLTEAQIIELDDGRLRFYMRNHNAVRSVAIAESQDGGITFNNFRYDESLPQCICQLSVIKLENMDKPYVLLCNPASKTERKQGTVRLSTNDGTTFEYSKLIREGVFIYSSMVQLDKGKIGILYEPANECTTIDYITLDIQDIMGGKKGVE